MGAPAVSRLVDRYGRRHAAPVPPVWFSDTIEKWARRWGRSATTRWEPAVGCFVTFFSRRAGDPVLRAVQEGSKNNEGEPKYWHEWKEGVRKHPITGMIVGGFVPMDIEQMGAEGVERDLDRGNMWSGRGEFSSLEAAADAHEAQNARLMQYKHTMIVDSLIDPARAMFREARGLPTVNVPEQIHPTKEQEP